MPLHLPTFFTRLGSAVVFSAIMMLGLLWNQWSFLALVSLILVLCLWEYFRITALINNRPERKTLKWLTIFTALALLILAGLQLQYSSDTFTLLFLSLLFIIPVILLLTGTLAPDGKVHDGLEAIGGLFYIALPCILLLAMRDSHWYLPLVLILCIWMNDTMAYLVGSFIGKTPFSSISPKKTWEGTAGGAVLTVAGALIAAFFIPGQSLAIYAAIALCAAIAGTAGDLLESKLKRMAGVKDSGRLMPGHGGALDRFDSLLVATPFAFVAIMMLKALV